MECHNKIWYPSVDTAKQAIEIMKKQGYYIPRNFKEYYCEQCNCWHVGHDKYKV